MNANGDRPVECPTCGKMCRNPNALRSHIRNHERNFQCDKCPRRFSMPSHLRRHVEQEHEGKYDQVPCSECGEAFKSAGQLKTHKYRVHSIGDAHLCSECWYSTHSSTHLRKHMLRHAGMDLFVEFLRFENELWHGRIYILYSNLIESVTDLDKFIKIFFKSVPKPTTRD